MQEANFSISAAACPGEEGVPPVAAGAAAVVVVVPMSATPACLAPAPQAARLTAKPATAGTAPSRRVGSW